MSELIVLTYVRTLYSPYFMLWNDYLLYVYTHELMIINGQSSGQLLAFDRPIQIQSDKFTIYYQWGSQ